MALLLAACDSGSDDATDARLIHRDIKPENMIRAHLGRHLTETQRRRWLNLLLTTADEVRPPERSRVSLRAGRLPRVGFAPGRHQLAAGRTRNRGRRHAQVGLG
jgi:hypothetical protein